MRSRTPNAITEKKKNSNKIKYKPIKTFSYSYNRPRYGQPWNRGQLIRPTKIVIVHTMQVMDDLNKTVLREKVVTQRYEHSFPLFAEPLQDINQPSDRWEGQVIINTLQGRYKARLKPPSRLHQRLEETTCKHTYIKTEPQKG